MPSGPGWKQFRWLAGQRMQFSTERIKGLVLVDAHWSRGWADEMLQTLGLKGEERNLKIMENFQNWLGRHSARKRIAWHAAEALVHHTSLLADLKVSESIQPDTLQTVLVLFWLCTENTPTSWNWSPARRPAASMYFGDSSGVQSFDHMGSHETLKSRIVQWLGTEVET